MGSNLVCWDLQPSFLQPLQNIGGYYQKLLNIQQNCQKSDVLWNVAKQQIGGWRNLFYGQAWYESTINIYLECSDKPNPIPLRWETVVFSGLILFTRQEWPCKWGLKNECFEVLRPLIKTAGLWFFWYVVDQYIGHHSLHIHFLHGLPYSSTSHARST